ncbi:MAG: hypothetical protein EOO68_26810, partial [Moraxellaceae bacterium]
MSDIKNPFDSLLDYFDDLLPSEELLPVRNAEAIAPPTEKISPKPAVKPPSRKGFGSTLIDKTIQFDLGG